MPGQVNASGGSLGVDIETGEIQDAAVTLAKMANLATDRLIGRFTAGTGVPEAVTCTDAAQSILDDATVAAMVDTLGGTAAQGTGAIVRATSPTLTTPALGTPSALVLTNATGLPAAQVLQGTMASGMVLVAPVLGTPASGNLANCTGATVDASKRIFGSHKTPGTGSTLTAYNGCPTHTLTGEAQSNISDSTGAYVRSLSTVAAAAVNGVQIASTECVKTEIGPIVTFTIKTGTLPVAGASDALTAGRYWVGLMSAFTAADSDQGAAHVLAFRYSPFVDTTAFWRVYTNDGGATENVVTTSIAIAADTRYVLKIDASDPTSVKFYINGTLATTVVTDLPTTTQALGCVCGNDSLLNAVSQDFYISKIEYQTN